MLLQAPDGHPMLVRITDEKGIELLHLHAAGVGGSMLYAPVALPCEVPPGKGTLHVMVVRLAPGPLDDSDEADEFARAVVKLAGYFETLHPDMQQLYNRALERVRVTAQSFPEGTE